MIAEKVRTRSKTRTAPRTLKQALDGLYADMDLKTVSPDPLELVLRYPDPHDQEVAGLLASAWAYGRAERIRADAGRGLARMGRSPSAFVDRLSADPSVLRTFEGLRHRFHRGGDWAALAWFASELRAEHGSIARAFSSTWQRSGGDLRGALSELHRAFHGGRYVERIKAAAPALSFGDLKHLLPDASLGSACKRLNLYLRWMVRRDRVDPGPWRHLTRTGPRPSDLVIPLDTHIARLGRSLGLTRRKTPDWTMATEITASLSRYDREDPVKYDFALCRLGILEICPRKRTDAGCRPCPIRRFCRF